MVLAALCVLVEECLLSFQLKYRVLYEVDMEGKHRQILVPFEGDETETLELDYSGPNLIPTTALEVAGATETIVDAMQETAECLEEVIDYKKDDLLQDSVPEQIVNDSDKSSSMIDTVHICVENDGSVVENVQTSDLADAVGGASEPRREFQDDSSVGSGIDFVTNPDFSKQEYYNWLTRFTELCKVVPMPLETSLFQKISQVHKTVSDVMATPSGVVADKENFIVLMNITKELSSIINEHLMYVMQNLDKPVETE